MAIVKKLYGNTGSYFNKIKKWMNKEEWFENPIPKSKSLSEIVIDNLNTFSKKLKELGEIYDTAEKASDRSDQKAEER